MAKPSLPMHRDHLPCVPDFLNDGSDAKRADAKRRLVERLDGLDDDRLYMLLDAVDREAKASQRQKIDAEVLELVDAPLIAPISRADRHGRPWPRTPFCHPSLSVRSGYLVCLLDGRRLRTMSRHLRYEYGLSPDQYRAMFDLPYDYPMTCAEYSATAAKRTRERKPWLNAVAAKKRKALEPKLSLLEQVSHLKTLSDAKPPKVQSTARK